MDIKDLHSEVTGTHPASVPDLPAIQGNDRLDGHYPVSALASLTIGTAAHCLQRYAHNAGQSVGPVSINQRLASLWFKSSVRPVGWSLPPAWDSVAGIYKATDTFIRLHTNAAHHRAVALDVLGVDGERQKVAQAVSGWSAHALEQAIVDAGGCAAALRSRSQWLSHDQGRAVGAEPLVAWRTTGEVAPPVGSVSANRPLAGIRVLDLTRVLAGPTSTRWLAAFGATVLRIDPQHWDEPACTVEMSAGKYRAHLDLREPAGRQQFTALLRDADVLVHGYRADALERLGLGDKNRQQINPAMIDVALCAYGWTGPWRYRRGFDSLVQMSCGIAHTGAELGNADQPVPLPAQALDYATGYLMAASVVHALDQRRQTGAVMRARLSLARTAELLEQLMSQREVNDRASPLVTEPAEADFQRAPEHSDWGPLQRLRWPVEQNHWQPSFDVAAGNLRTSSANWPDKCDAALG